MKRPWIRFFLAVAFLVLALVVFLVIEHERGRRELRRIEAELRAQGEKLTIQELAPPLPPLESNGLPDFISSMATVGTPPAPSATRFAAPNHQILVTRMERWPASTGGTTNNWSALEAWVESRYESIDNLTAALDKPHFVAVVDWSQGSSMPLTHLSALRSGAMLLNAACALHLHEDDPEEIIATLRDLNRLAAALKSDPLLIGQLVRLAVGGIGSACWWQALEAREWTGGELEQLQRLMIPQDYATGMMHALEMERAWSQDAFNRMRLGEISGNELSMLIASGELFSSESVYGKTLKETAEFLKVDQALSIIEEYVVAPIWRFAWLDQCTAYHHRVMRDLIESAREQARNRKLDSAWMQQFSKSIDNPGAYDRIRFSPVHSFIPALGKAMTKALKQDTIDAMNMTVVALKLYRIRHGGFPENLSSLVPEFLPELPIDRMDGKPLRYRQNDDGSFILYSVGEDARDDGGDPNPPEPKARIGTIWQGRDAVWPRPASVEQTRESERKALRENQP